MYLSAGVIFENKLIEEEVVISEYPIEVGMMMFQFPSYKIHISIIDIQGTKKITAKLLTEESVSSILYFKISYDKGTLFSYNGEEKAHSVLRQSPHNPDNHKIDMPKQAVPVVSIKSSNIFLCAFHDNPAKFYNYCTQEFNPKSKHVMLLSGDRGINTHKEGLFFKPHFVNNLKTFEIYMSEINSQTLAGFRISILKDIAKIFGKSGNSFYSMNFALNYMHYRKNETGYSDYWLVPGIDYANKQYTRDAFWQSMILPLEMEQQIYNAVYPKRYKYAENAMLYIIWSMRIFQRGGDLNKERVMDALKYIEQNTINDIFYAPSVNGRPTFKSWYDICAFEDDDLITYNQGLLVVALKCLKEMNIESKIVYDTALKEYKTTYIEEDGYFPLSKKKTFFAVDALAGELLSLLLFQEALLEDSHVHRHFQFMTQKAKTQFGFKVTSKSDGGYLSAEDHLVPGFTHEFYERAKPGMYLWGGSYFLYDMLSLIPCYLHGAKDVLEEIIWRTELEINLGGTTHEHINTVTGEPGKANQGWNAAVYSIYNQLMSDGKASREYFDKINNKISTVIFG